MIVNCWVLIAAVRVKITLKIYTESERREKRIGGSDLLERAFGPQFPRVLKSEPVVPKSLPCLQHGERVVAAQAHLDIPTH